MSGKLFTFILIVLCGHIGFVWTQDYNYEDYVDAYGCNGWTEYFCSSTDRFNNASELCDGQCGYPYYFKSFNDTCNLCNEYEHFCSSTDMCINASESCDGQCGRLYHFCPSTDSCIYETTPCKGNCPEDLPNICDNGTYCYPSTWINSRSYACADRSDEHRPTEEASPLDNSSLDKFLQLNTGEDKYGYPCVDCQDGTVYPYRWWCVDKYRKICGGVSTTDYFICHNSSLWEDRLCGYGYVRGCKVPGKCSLEGGKCNGQVGNIDEGCGASDYSDEVCPVNEEHSRYFRCKDNSSLIHPTLVCDGFKHCNDLSDENECDICPRVNNMEVHGQMVQLKVEEMRDLTHLKSMAIMRPAKSSPRHTPRSLKQSHYISSSRNGKSPLNYQYRPHLQ